MHSRSLSKLNVTYRDLQDLETRHLVDMLPCFTTAQLFTKPVTILLARWPAHESDLASRGGKLGTTSGHCLPRTI